TLTNSGVSDADNVTITDLVDSRLVVTAVTGTASVCAPASQAVSCTLAHLAGGGSETVTVTYSVASTTDSATVSNTANATSDEDSASDTDSVDIAEDVQLSVSKTFATPTVTAGGSASGFSISVHNAGASDADNVLVTDVVDGRLVVTAVTSGSFTCLAPSQTVSCSLVHLAAGATATISVTFHVETDTDSDPAVSNSATASSDEDSANDTTSVAIVENVDLSVDKAFASPSVTAGGAASSFSISVHNSGSSDADNLNLTDTVDPRLVVDSITAGAYTCAPASQSISCTLAHLGAGATQAITVHFHVASTTNADPAVSNTANATSDEDSASDSDSVAIAEDVQLSVDKEFNS